MQRYFLSYHYLGQAKSTKLWAILKGKLFFGYGLPCTLWLVCFCVLSCTFVPSVKETWDNFVQFFPASQESPLAMAAAAQKLLVLVPPPIINQRYPQQQYPILSHICCTSTISPELLHHQFRLKQQKARDITEGPIFGLIFLQKGAASCSCKLFDWACPKSGRL